MTLAAGTGFATYERGGAWQVNDSAPRDISKLFLSALREDHGLVSKFSVGEAFTNEKHEWFEDAINPDKITLVAGSSSVEDGDSTTLFTGSAAHIKTVKVGDRLKNATRNIPEVMLVTAVASTTTLTVERGFGQTIGSVSHMAGDKFWVMPANQQGSGPGSDRTLTRTPKYNWPQLIDLDVIMTRAQVNNPMYNVVEEFDKSLLDRTYEGKRYLNNVVINSVSSGMAGALPAATNYPSMSGVIEMIGYDGLPTGADSSGVYTNSTTIDSSTTALSAGALSDLIGSIYAQGGASEGSNMIIATNQTEFEVMADWPAGQIRRDYGTSGMTYGGTVTQFISKQNVSCPIVVDNYIPVGHLLVLDLSRISLHPATNTSWVMYKNEIGDNRNDYKAARLLGEWTLEMHNAGTAHGMMTALADI